MHIKVITPDRKVFEGEVSQAKFPGMSGQFEVLKDHAAMISMLGEGPLILNTTEGLKTFMIEGGVVEILRNQINVLVEALLPTEA
ncbi:MAG: F0F1 ATP synthase subunit epsilon [Microscillaceae bacterium]|nr:F0F1 ATP synthase subunit epsilon [Microscillaceae bacterium]